MGSNMRIGNREFVTQGKSYIMGILNVTPDSFSDGGQFNDLDAALFQVEKMITEGMDILDIGGESTKPNYIKVSEQEETERVLPIIRAVKQRFDIPVSLDTYKANVASAAVKEGIDLINDIWGLRYESQVLEREQTVGDIAIAGNAVMTGNIAMAEVIARSKLPCCLMHNRKKAEYTGFLQEVAADLAHSLYLAEKAGISQDSIILDPGVGFAKSYEQNLMILKNLEAFKVLGCPILLGASRKSVVGLTLDLPAGERLEGTLATTVVAVMKGCMFVRVHDIKENVRVVKMTEAILNV